MDNIITLQSDMVYTIQVSFSNLEVEFNITKGIKFSTWKKNCYTVFLARISRTIYILCRVYRRIPRVGLGQLMGVASVTMQEETACSLHRNWNY